MNSSNYWLSRVRPAPHLDYERLGRIAGSSAYGHHKNLWRLFDLPSREPGGKADFLFRYEVNQGMPTFYVLSPVVPDDKDGVWHIEPKPYRPDIRNGDRLAFKLRVNPIRHDKRERTETEIEAWRASREGRGLKEKDPTKKRIRHDVVMEAKNRIGFKTLPRDRRPHVATLIQKAGMTWLKEKEEKFGFFVEDNQEKPQVRVDGYLQHTLYKGRGTRPITFSTLDFDGILTVIDPDIFVTKCLFTGIGPAKAFGCGLMLVRRI